jgi:DNA-binding CsgD family transcriptional regulator
MSVENRMLGPAEMESIVEILVTVSDPTRKLTIVERKRQLLEFLREMIDADVYIWSAAIPNPAQPGDVMTVGLIDGGWKDEDQRACVMRALTNPQFAVKIGEKVTEAAANARYTTFQRSEIVSDEWWEANAEIWRQAGLNHVILNVFPLGQKGFSGTGFHRLEGRPPFTERERAWVHAALKHVHWFHQHTIQQEDARPKVLELTPRERQTLILLLTGQTKKEIAAKLHITENTVGDYTKKIYRHFAVSSRGELQAIFMSGRTGG